MAPIPYMPLYISDYLADAAHLSTVEHGAYLLLIMNYWQRGKPLPDSNERLANVARLSIEGWTAIRATIAEFFVQDGDVWRHKRIDAELTRFREKSAKASASGRASAERRSNGRSTNVERTLNYSDTDTDTENHPKRPVPVEVLPVPAPAPDLGGAEPLDWLKSWYPGEQAADDWRTFAGEINTPELLDALIRHGPEWAKTKKYASGYAPKLKFFLRDKPFLRAPPPEMLGVQLAEMDCEIIGGLKPKERKRG